MSIAGGTHLFGSRAGYTTLAQSPDITAAEQQELSILGFGQTSDPRFLESLQTQPCAYGRRLRSGRFAITRCFKGELDDAGRSTLQFFSVVLEARDYLALINRDLSPFLNDQTIWAHSNFIGGKRIAIPNRPSIKTRSVLKSDLLVLDAWLGSITDPGSLSVLPDDAGDAEGILHLPQVLAEEDRLQYRWGLRLLGAGVPADICTLANGANRSGRRKINVFHNGREWRHPAVAHLEQCLATRMENLPTVRSIMPYNLARDEAADMVMIPMPRSRRSNWMARIGVTVAILLITATGLTVSKLFSARHHQNNVGTTEAGVPAIQSPPIVLVSPSDLQNPASMPIDEAAATRASNIGVGVNINGDVAPAKTSDDPSAAPNTKPATSPTAKLSDDTNPEAEAPKTHPQPPEAEPSITHSPPPAQLGTIIDSSDILRNGLPPIEQGAAAIAESLSKFLEAMAAIKSTRDRLEEQRRKHEQLNKGIPFSGAQELQSCNECLQSGYKSLIRTIPGLVDSLLETVKSQKLTTIGGVSDCELFAQYLNISATAITTLQKIDNKRDVDDAIASEEGRIRNECKDELERVTASTDNEETKRHNRSIAIRRREDGLNQLKQDWHKLRSDSETHATNLRIRASKLVDKIDEPNQTTQPDTQDRGPK